MPTPPFAPTLASAVAADSADLLGDWLQAFLRGIGGNVGLADGLLKEPRGYRFAEVELDTLKTICGPSPSFEWPEEPERFEERVAAMATAVAEGWEPPPLIAHFPSHKLNDGNHRCEALRRADHEHYWTILYWTLGEESPA